MAIHLAMRGKLLGSRPTHCMQSVCGLFARAAIQRIVFAWDMRLQGLAVHAATMRSESAQEEERVWWDQPWGMENQSEGSFSHRITTTLKRKRQIR
jgi:hypothetical protein